MEDVSDTETFPDETSSSNAQEPIKQKVVFVDLEEVRVKNEI